MNESDEEDRDFLRQVCEKRNTGCFFDRFERYSVMSSGLRLHLDVNEVDKRLPTVIFMPGTNACAALCGEFLTALADSGYDIAGFDPRGHGRSGCRLGSYSVQELMADMRAAVRHARKRFGDPPVSGSSQGGITAFYNAAEGNR